MANSTLCTCMLIACTRMLLVYYSYVPVCYSYVFVCYSYVLVSYSNVLVSYSYVLVSYSYLTRILLMRTRILLLCIRMLVVCIGMLLVWTRVVFYSWSATLPEAFPPDHFALLRSPVCLKGEPARRLRDCHVMTTPLISILVPRNHLHFCGCFRKASFMPSHV